MTCRLHDERQTGRPLPGRTVLRVCASLNFTLSLVLVALSTLSSSSFTPSLESGSIGGGGGDTRKPVITRPPTDIFSVDGVIEFTCQADGQPKPTIQWYDAGTRQPVIDRVPTSGMTSGIHVNQHYGRLLVSNPTKHHIYSFYCNASNSAGWVASHPPVKGGLAYLETVFRKLPIDKTVYRYDQVVLDCEPPVGVPQPKIMWLRDEQLIVSSENFTNSQSIQSMVDKTSGDHGLLRLTAKGSLQIKSVDIKDAGDYVCAATNAAGKVMSPPVRLKVIPRVRFLETPSDVRVRKGSNAEFRCRIDGDQLVQWGKRRGEGDIDASRAEYTESHLLLKNVQLSDAGTYICSVPGVITSTAMLTVETPPVFQQTPDDVQATVGSDVVFRCATTGYPKPSIYWELPDKTPIFPTEYSSAGRYYLHREGQLEIKNVQLVDAGRYQCTAHSSIDRIHSSAHLKVLPAAANSQMASGERHMVNGKPDSKMSTNFGYDGDLYPPAPVIGLPPMNQTRFVGDLVTLDCELTVVQEQDVEYRPRNMLATLDFAVQQRYAAFLGYSATEWPVSWHRATLATGNLPKKIDFSAYEEDQRYRLLPGGSLQIMDIQLGDTGIYTCSAKSIVGRTNANDISSLILQQSNWTAQLIVVSQPIISNSDPRLENPLSPPRHLRVTNLTESTVTLNWEHSEPETVTNGNEKLQPTQKIGYWVEFYRIDRPLDGWVTVERSWPANWVQIGGLQPQTGYYFLIRPRYRAGRLGWASQPIGPLFTLGKSTTRNTEQDRQTWNQQLLHDIKYLKVSTIDVYPLSPNRLHVSWTLSGQPMVLNMISGYHIHYQPVSLFQCLPNKLVGEETTFDKAGWRNYLGENYCSLRFSQEGNTNLKLSMLYQELQEIQTLRSETTSLESEERSHDPATHSTPRNSVDVEVDEVQQVTTTLDLHAVVYHGQGIIADLKPFHCYTVTVQPYANRPQIEKIEARESVSASVLTYESFPNKPPTRIAARWRTADEVELSWLPPLVTSWNGLLKGYIIYAYDELGRNHQTFNITVHERMTRITGLGGPSVILIQMAAVNCHGVGLRSKPLKLEPQYKKQGFGAGYGFSTRDGTSTSRNVTDLSRYVNASSTPPSSALSDQFIHKPWFVAAVVFGILLWFTFIGLIIFLYRRQRLVLSKGTAGVLITNKSHCDTTNSQLDTTNSSHYAKEKNTLLLEPLIGKDPASIKQSDMDLSGNFVRSSHAMRATPDEFNITSAPYAGYSITPSNMDFNQNAHNQQIVSNGTFRGPVHPMMHPSVTAGHFGESGATGIYATTGPETLTDHSLNAGYNPQASLFAVSPSNHASFQPVASMLSQNCASLPIGFITPQSHILLQPSESTTDFSKMPGTHCNDQVAVITATERSTVASLPPIAPVARLGVNDTIYCVNNVPPISLVADGYHPPVSVTPYATASIIHNSGNNENASNLAQVFNPHNCLSRSNTREPQCSVDYSKDCCAMRAFETSAYQPTSTHYASSSTDERLRIPINKNQFDTPGSGLITDLMANSGNLLLVSGTHTSPVSLLQGSSEEHSSRSSSNTANSGAHPSQNGKNVKVNRMGRQAFTVISQGDESAPSCVHYMGHNDSNSSGTSTNQMIIPHTANTNINVWASRIPTSTDDKLTFFSERPIPPPPRSPPPPAPTSSTTKQNCVLQSVSLGASCSVTKQEDYYQLSGHSSSTTCSPANSHSDIEELLPNVQGTGLISSQHDEKHSVKQTELGDTNLPSGRFAPVQRVIPKRLPLSSNNKLLTSRCDLNSESPYCLPGSTDDPHNSTYAQVY